MQVASILSGARKLVHVCCRVQPGEKVAVVADFDTQAVAEAITCAALEITPEVVTTFMAPRQVDSSEPPEIVAAAMKAADVAIIPVSYTIAHSNAVRAALGGGTRVMSVPAATPIQLVRGGAEADFEANSATVKMVGQALSNATTAHLTTPGGTDCTFDLSGRKGNSHDCILDRPGKFSAYPNSEANISPVDGRTNGVIVFDGSIPNLRLGGPLRNPVRCTVRDGNIVKVEGGPEADMIAKVWAAMGDASVYNIAQLAVGLNPEVLILSGVWAQDHGAWGTVHIGIGTSTNLGGTTKAASHFDGMMYRPTLTLDGQVILKDGVLQL